MAKTQIILRRAPKGGLKSRTGRSYKGGQFIDTRTWRGEMVKARRAMEALLADFAEQMTYLVDVFTMQCELSRFPVEGVIPISMDRTAERMAREISISYARAFQLGKRAAGNLLSATSSERGRVQSVIDDELRYLERFISDIRNGRGRVPYSLRADMYGAAIREVFWLGWVLGDTSFDRKITWHVNPHKEHCADCVRYARHGPYSVQDFIAQVLNAGHVPQSGSLKCLGFRCGCWLSDNRIGADRPKWVNRSKPENAESR